MQFHNAWVLAFYCYDPVNRKLVRDVADSFILFANETAAVDMQQYREYVVGNPCAIIPPSTYQWTETTEEHYTEMLGMLPPATMTDYGFLVGEAVDHHPILGTPRFAAFIQLGARFFMCRNPMTRHQFRDHLDMPSIAAKLGVVP